MHYFVSSVMIIQYNNIISREYYHRVNADEGVSRAGEGERDLGRVGDKTMHL